MKPHRHIPILPYPSPTFYFMYVLLVLFLYFVSTVLFVCGNRTCCISYLCHRAVCSEPTHWMHGLAWAWGALVSVLQKRLYKRLCFYFLNFEWTLWPQWMHNTCAHTHSYIHTRQVFYQYQAGTFGLTDKHRSKCSPQPNHAMWVFYMKIYVFIVCRNNLIWHHRACANVKDV